MILSACAQSVRHASTEIGSIMKAVQGHLRKADYLAIDLRKLTEAQRKAIRRNVLMLADQDQARVFYIE
jgi:hypothetical protein